MKINGQNKKALVNLIEAINVITATLDSKGQRKNLLLELKEIRQKAFGFLEEGVIPDNIVHTKSTKDIAETQVDKLKFEGVCKENSVDNVNHPKHYTSHPSGVECIDITRYYPFAIGCAIKYLWRAGLKSDASLSDKEKEIEDLNKAIWYINDRIKQLKNE